MICGLKKNKLLILPVNTCSILCVLSLLIAGGLHFQSKTGLVEAQVRERFSRKVVCRMKEKLLELETNLNRKKSI